MKSLSLISVATALRSSPIKTQDLDKVAAANLAAYRADKHNIRSEMHKASSARHDNQHRLLSKFASETVNVTQDASNNAFRETALKENAVLEKRASSNDAVHEVQAAAREENAPEALRERATQNASRTEDKAKAPAPPNVSLKVFARSAQDAVDNGGSVQAVNKTQTVSNSLAEKAGMDRKVQPAPAVIAASKVELQKSVSQKYDAVQDSNMTHLTSDEKNNIIRYAGMADARIGNNSGADIQAPHAIAVNASSKVDLQNSDITHSMLAAHAEHVANSTTVAKDLANISHDLDKMGEHNHKDHPAGHLNSVSHQAASSVHAIPRFAEQHLDDVAAHKQASMGGHRAAVNMTPAVVHEEKLVDSVFHDLELETRTQTAAEAWTKAMTDLSDMARPLAIASDGGRKARAHPKTAAEAWAKMDDMASKLSDVVSNSGGDRKAQMSKSFARFENTTGNMTLFPRHHFARKAESAHTMTPPAVALKAISSGGRNLLHGTAVRKANESAVHNTDVAHQEAVPSHEEAEASARYLADRHARHLADKVRANQAAGKAPLSKDVATHKASPTDESPPSAHEALSGKHASIAFDLANMARAANRVHDVLHNDTRRRLMKKITEEWERNVIKATGLGKAAVSAVHKTDVQQGASSQAAVRTKHVVSKVKAASAASTDANGGDITRKHRAKHAGRNAPPSKSKNASRYEASASNVTLLPRHHFSRDASMALDLAHMAAAADKVDAVLHEDAQPSHQPHAVHTLGAELKDYLSGVETLDATQRSESEAAQRGLRALVLSLIPKKTSVLVDGATLHGA